MPHWSAYIVYLHPWTFKQNLKCAQTSPTLSMISFKMLEATSNRPFSARNRKAQQPWGFFSLELAHPNPTTVSSTNTRTNYIPPQTTRHRTRSTKKTTRQRTRLWAKTPLQRLHIQQQRFKKELTKKLQEVQSARNTTTNTPCQLTHGEMRSTTKDA